MKALLSTALLFFSSQSFAAVGFGVTGSQNLFTVNSTTSRILIDDPAGGEQLDIGSYTNHGFGNVYAIGGYLNIDAIPFVTLDVEASFAAAKYDFSFQNESFNLDKESFPWAAFSSYGTMQRDLFKLKIPALSKFKMYAGAGANYHSVTPMVSQEMAESVISDGDIQNGQFEPNDLIKYLYDNRINSTGFHVEGGVRLKILTLEGFVYYRHVFVQDVVPGTGNFGSLNARVGFGF